MNLASNSPPLPPESVVAALIAPQEKSRVRLVVFILLLAAWIAFLIAIYVQWVQPARESRPKTEPAVLPA